MASISNADEMSVYENADAIYESDSVLIPKSVFNKLPLEK